MSMFEPVVPAPVAVGQRHRLQRRGIEVDRDPFAAVFDRARAAGLHSVPLQ